MENSDSMKISIPKSCHEDWNKMTPNEQGSFCGKCCKTVVDFTNKSADQIKNILLEQSGKKVCGRFMTDQLDEPAPSIHLNIPLYLLPRNISFSRSFGIALFIAFGTTLFSCTTTENHVVGDIVINDSAKVITTEKIIDSAKQEKPLISDTIPVNHELKKEKRKKLSVPMQASNLHPAMDLSLSSQQHPSLLPILFLLSVYS